MDAEMMKAAVDVLMAAATLAVCVLFWHRTAKREKGMPPPVCSRDGFGWRRGDALASAGDWWRWQIYATLILTGATAAITAAQVLDIPLVSEIVGVGAFLFYFSVFSYFGMQRFIAAGRSGLWIFVFFVLEGAVIDIESYIFSTIMSIAILVYVGTLHNAAPRAELTGDKATGDNKAAAV